MASRTADHRGVRWKKDHVILLLYPEKSDIIVQQTEKRFLILFLRLPSVLRRVNTKNAALF